MIDARRVGMIAQPEHQHVNPSSIARSKNEAEVCRDPWRRGEGASSPSSQPVPERDAPRQRRRKSTRHFARNRVRGCGEVRVLRERKAQLGQIPRDIGVHRRHIGSFNEPVQRLFCVARRQLAPSARSTTSRSYSRSTASALSGEPGTKTAPGRRSPRIARAASSSNRAFSA
jgi:hypothetical protein